MNTFFETFIELFFHEPHTTISNSEKMFSSNSEVSASELLEYLPLVLHRQSYHHLVQIVNNILVCDPLFRHV